MVSFPFIPHSNQYVAHDSLMYCLVALWACMLEMVCDIVGRLLKKKKKKCMVKNNKTKTTPLYVIIIYSFIITTTIIIIIIIIVIVAIATTICSSNSSTGSRFPCFLAGVNLPIPISVWD